MTLFVQLSRTADLSSECVFLKSNTRHCWGNVMKAVLLARWLCVDNLDAELQVDKCKKFEQLFCHMSSKHFAKRFVVNCSIATAT